MTFCADLSLVGDDIPFARRQPLDRRHPRVPVDGGARIARALGERLRQLRRVDVTIVRVVESRLQIVGGDVGVTLHDLRRRQHLELDPLRAGLRHHVLELVDAIARVGESDAAGDVIVDVVADTLRELGIQARTVTLQLDQIPGRGKVRAVAGCVPG